MNRELEEAVRPFYKESRYAHTLRCRDMAVRLAERWGCDTDKAEKAALLHDVTKKLNEREHLQLCREYGIINKYSDEEFSDLIHADTAAAVARDKYDMPEDICRAIARHTLGGIDMTLLEKIIYLADAIEEGRDYPGVGRLRLLAFEDIDRAVLESLESTIAHVEAQGREPNRQSRAAADFLKKEIGKKHGKHQ